MNDEHQGTDELERRLEAYASARLAPDRLAPARMRAALVEEARLHTLRASLRRGSRVHRAWRGAAAVFLAAALAAGAVASVAAASTAGGPLYQARIWLETAALPSNPDARALERLHQIDERVRDVERAVASGDQAAVAAAISAYRDALGMAVQEADNHTDRLDHLKAALGLHLVVLETVSGHVPKPAMTAIDGAIQASRTALDQIDTTITTDGQGAGRPGHANGNGTPNGGSGPAASASPTDTLAPPLGPNQSVEPSLQPSDLSTPRPSHSPTH